MIETRFKDTEIGKIPADWETNTIGKVTQVSSGGTPSTSEHSYWGGDIPWMNSGELNLKIVNSVAGRITEKGLSSSSTKWIPSECVLIGLAGQGKTRGTAAFNTISLCINQSIGAIFPSDHLDNKFLYYYMNTLYHHLRKISDGGGGRGGLTKALLQGVYVPIPSKDEQSRIASALTSIDNLISSLDKLIEKKKNIKQGTMQQLLTGKKRLKGFSEPWMEKKLSEIGVLSGAGVDKLSKPNEIPVRLLNYLDVFHRDHIYNNELKMWVTANDAKVIACNVFQGDVFFTPSSEMPYDIALSAVAMEDMQNVCYSYHIYRLRFFEEFDFKYKAYMFKSQDFYNQANLTCEGSGKRYVISLSKFRELSIRYPQSLEEQGAIANILTSMDNEISALEAKKAKYESMKQGMMQQLLTGKIRLI